MKKRKVQRAPKNPDSFTREESKDAVKHVSKHWQQLNELNNEWQKHLAKK